MTTADLGTTPRDGGDPDIAWLAGLFADPTRARVLQALSDGRALPASVLAAEAGVSPQAASSQLNRLRDGGLIVGERSGRHRYYRLASDRVGGVLEALAAAAPTQPIRSLRQDTRAGALRRARTCYDHLAGRVGCAVTQALLDREALTADDGLADTRRRVGDALSAVLHEHPYRPGPRLREELTALGVDPAPLLDGGTGRRPLLRFCLDWSEQRHHVAGGLGAALLTGFEEQGWISRRPRVRAVTVTPAGRAELGRRLALDLSDAA